MNAPVRTPNRFPRDLLIIAGHELTDALRSRRGIVLVLLFLIAIVTGVQFSIRFIFTLETGLSEALGLDAARRAGGVSTTLWQNAQFRHAITGMIGDRALANALLSVPPLSLFYCGIVFFATPLLVALTCAPRLADELWSGAARFVLFRTTRLAWGLGRLLGQALQLLIAFLLSVPAAWLCGALQMDGFARGATLLAMLVFAIKAWVFGLCYLGIVSGLSLVCRGPGLATALGIGVLPVLSALFHASRHYAGDGWRRLFDLTALLTPRAHYFDLLRPDLPHALSGAVFLILLGLGYFGLGYARFARKDL